MLLFETRVAVPKNVVYQIGMQVVDRLIEDLLKSSEFGVNDINLIKHKAENAALAYANTQEKSCEGWSIEKDQAVMIADQLRRGLKIAAIKEFRAATGAGLRDAKLFLDKFEPNEVGAMEFMAVFV